MSFILICFIGGLILSHMEDSHRRQLIAIMESSHQRQEAIDRKAEIAEKHTQEVLARLDNRPAYYSDDFQEAMSGIQLHD